MTQTNSIMEYHVVDPSLDLFDSSLDLFNQGQFYIYRSVWQINLGRPSYVGVPLHISNSVVRFN